MPTIEKHPAGAFTWIELATTDQNAAKAFYTSLLGWTANDSPMGPDAFYTMFQLNGRNVGAAYTLHEQERANHVPPHWNLYIGTDDADQTAKRAGELGGTALAGPFDVYDFGRMGVIRDPTGAVFCIWQPKQHTGMGLKNEPGTFCWADLSTAEPDKAKSFYSSLFGWEIEPGQDGSGYEHIKNAGEFIGGIPPAQHRDPSTPPHWLSYILVNDCDASTNKAKQLGAKVYMEPMTMEKVGRFSIIADPQGAVISLFEAARK